MKTFLSKLFFSIIFISAVSFSCKNDNDEPVSENLYFISAKPIGETSLFLLKAGASSVADEELVDKLKYSVRTYKLLYKTTYHENIITVSGLLFLPQELKDPAPLISVQHGTTFIKGDAPSVTKEITGTEFLASAGYVAIMPDYIGYGESEDIFHPYYDKIHSANSVIDMIKATKEFLRKHDIRVNDKLFLTGYSEGGYVTLAAANILEESPESAFSITALAAGAGGYDLRAMLKGITTTNYYSYPSYLAFVLISYNYTYGWNKPLSYFFKQPYADSIARYMDGKHSGGFINSKLTTTMSDLLEPGFFEQLKSSEGEIELKEAIKTNSISGWNTQTPIRLFHGTKDEIIPYENSEITLQNFKILGSNNISLTPIPNGTHSSSFIPMLAEIIPWLEQFQE